MNDNEYSLAGWLAIAAAVLALPSLFLGIVTDIMKAADKPPVFMPLAILVTLLQLGFAVYALARFRTFLNKRHEFHAVDTLIVLIIGGFILITFVGVVGRVVAPAGEAHPLTLLFIGLIFLIGIPLSILSIIFALKLRDLDSDLAGYKTPFIYLTIGAAICFATLILAPIGMLLDAAGNALLGMIFLKSSSDSAVPEFV